MKKTIISLLLTLLIIGCYSSKEQKITGTTGKVVEVIDGSHIRLQNGLTVELIGIDPSALGEKYMNSFVKGKTVRLVADKQDIKQTYKSKSSTVRAYVRVDGMLGSLNGKLLKEGWADGLNLSFLQDSATAYSQYWKNDEQRVLLNDAELQYKIKPATFLVGTESGYGTGFYISSTGIALTNNHVLNDNDTERYIVPFGEDGSLDVKRSKTVGKILYTYHKDKIDFTIFQVNLDRDEKVSYLKLSEKHLNDGERIAKLGCPAGTYCNFQTGNLSNYNEGYYFTHSIASNHGDSGGPVVDFYGDVVGINQSIEFNEALSEMSGSLQKAEGIAYAVDISLVKSVLDNIGIQYGK